MTPSDIAVIVLCAVGAAIVSVTVGLCLWWRSWTPWPKQDSGLGAFLIIGSGQRRSYSDHPDAGVENVEAATATGFGYASAEQLLAGSRSQDLGPPMSASSYRTFSPTAQLQSPRRSRFGSGSSLTPTASADWSPFSSAGKSGARGGAAVTPSKSSVTVRKPLTLTGSRRQSSECLLMISPLPENISEGAIEYLRRRRASSFSDLHRRAGYKGPAVSETISTMEELGLDPSLYPSSPDPETQHETLLGRLCIRLELLPKKSTLLVTVSRAKYLLRRRPSNMCMFYATVTYKKPCGIVEKRKTQLVNAACNPQFDRQFVLPYSQQDEPGTELVFKVKENAQVGKPHVIGHCAVQIATLVEMGPGGHEIWRELQPVVVFAGNETQTPGKIFLSLSYNQQKKLLTLGIVEGKDLRVRETDAYVYFRASIMARERTVKAKKTPLIKENVVNPTIQQEFRYHLAPNLTDQVYLFILICAKSRLGANRLLGKVVIGSANFAQGSGVEQWTDCFRNQPSIVHQWHDIY